ncbi:hypothetical protein [Lacinutrix sp. MEBiC02404]
MLYKSAPGSEIIDDAQVEIDAGEGARGKIYDWEQSNTNTNAGTLDPNIHKLPTPK